MHTGKGFQVLLFNIYNSIYQVFPSNLIKWFQCNRKNPTNTNALKLKKAQNELASIYLKEQTEYIQNQIDKIRDSVENRQSRVAWQTINEVSRRKSTAKAKLKATNQ